MFLLKFEFRDISNKNKFYLNNRNNQHKEYFWCSYKIDKYMYVTAFTIIETVVDVVDYILNVIFFTPKSRCGKSIYGPILEPFPSNRDLKQYII